MSVALPDTDTTAGRTHMDAISIPFDPQHWTRQFLAQWPDGSDAHASYWQRIVNGPDYDDVEAVRTSEY